MGGWAYSDCDDLLSSMVGLIASISNTTSVDCVAVVSAAAGLVGWPLVVISACTNVLAIAVSTGASFWLSSSGISECSFSLLSAGSV